MHPSKRAAGAKGDPEIFTVKADENTTKNNGGRWHTDVSCDEIPPLGSILHLKDVPTQGGDTLFANMYLAYELLSEPVRRMLFAHIAQNPLLSCRVKWEPGTLVFWDNRCTQHFAVWDYFPHVRRGERVAIFAVSMTGSIIYGSMPVNAPELER